MRAYGLSTTGLEKTMAKKTLDDALDWDHSLDYEFEDPFAPVSKNQKRGVITRVATSFAAGAKDALTTPASLRSMASKMLPKGYGEAMDFADNIYRQGEELHNIALKELTPSIPAMRRITQRHLPKAKRFLPKSVAAQMQEFANEKPSASMSQQQLDEQAIQKGMAEVFGVQMEADARQNAENKIERAMQHAQSAKLSRQQLHSLNVMQQGVMRLVNYQDDITNKYQRRSLELQTRHYMVARDSLRLQVETARRMNAQLDALVTNTSMPDIQKQDLAHTAKQTFRTRLMGAAQASAGRFASNYFQNMSKRMQGNVRNMAGGINGAVDMMDGMDMGEDGPPMLEFLAQMAGQQLFSGGASLFGGKISGALAKKFPGLAQGGGFLQRMVTGAPYKINKYARSATKREGWGGIAEDFVKGALGTNKLDTTVGRSGIGGMDKPATFDRLTRTSIVEIIPGLLSRIEHNTARLLDPKAQRQHWNHDKRSFTNIAEAGEDMSKRIMAPSARASTKQSVNDFIDEIVGKAPISAETRKGWFRQLLLDSAHGEDFELERYVSPSTDTPELSARSKIELGKIFTQAGLIGKGKRDQTWLADKEKKYYDLDFGAVLPVSAAGVYRSAGQRELLESQGMIDRDGNDDKLRLSKFLDMVEAADYKDIENKERTIGERFKQQAERSIKGNIDGVSDLYVKGGGIKAVLDAGKLKAGAYRDAATGEILKKWEDIKGPIKDMTTDTIVCDTDTLTFGLVDSKGKTYTFNLRTATASAVNWASQSFNTARTTVNQRANEVKDIVNSRGEVLLQGWKLKAGKYRDALTKNVINKVEDIAGPVIDEDGRTVVTASDVANVISEQGGRPLVDALARMRQRTEEMTSQASSTLNPVFGTPSQAANNDFGQEASQNYGDLIRVNTEQVELLKQIAQILMAQGPNGGSGQDPTYRRGFLDSLAIGGIKGAWKGAKVVGSGAWWWTKKTVGGVFGGIGLAGRGVGAIASGTAHRVGNLVRGIKDIYVTGKRRPVLTAQRIKMGQYQDVNTKKTVSRWTTITGPVMDKKTGEIVLDQEDFDAGIYVKGPAGLVRLATKSIVGMGSAVVSFLGMGASMPFRAAAFAMKAVSTTLKWATNKQVDVYVKGESSPRLQATKMKTGRYYNAGPKKTGKVVSTYADIYGEIKELARGSDKASADDKTVLHENEIHDPGICSRWGLSLRTPLSRLIGAVGGAAAGMVKGAASLFGGAIKGAGKLLGGLLGFGGGAIGAAIGGPFKFLGALLNPFEKHGKKQVEWLEKIFNVLDSRLPGKKYRKGSWQEQAAADAEKDKSQDAEKKREEKDRKWGIGGLLSFFKNKAKGLFGGGDEEGEEEEGDGDDGDTTILAGGGGGDNDGKSRTKEQRRKDRLARAKSAKRRKGKMGAFFRAKDAMGRWGKKAPGAGSLGKAKGFLGSPAKMATAAAMMAGGDYALDKTLGEKSKARKVADTSIATAGTVGTASWLSGLVGGPTITSMLGMGGAGAAGGVTTAGAIGTTAVGTAGTAAAVVGAPIWIPLAIGAAAVAAVGAGIYFAHKQYKYGKLTPVRRFRYLQYGVSPGDAGNNKKIFALESLLLDHVGEKNGGLEILGKSNSGEKDITMEDVYKLMDMDDGWFSDNRQQRSLFNVWYAQRFKPIFLTWVKGLREVEPTMSLLDADEKLTGEKLKKVLTKAWGLSKNIYAISQGPFEGVSAVTDIGQIEDAYNLAVKEAGKTESDKKKDARKDTLRKIMNWTMPGAALGLGYLDNQRKEEEAKKEGAALSAKELEKNAGPLASTTGGMIKNTKGVDSILSTPLARLGKITPLAAIRYRAYGLTELDLDRVRALAALEAVVKQSISFADSGTPHLTTDVEQLYYKACGLFGLTASSVADRHRWAAWFGHRFFPVFRAYIKAVRTVAPSADLLQPERTLKADTLMNIAQQMMNAKDDDGKSIWFWTSSPWNAKERLNANSEAVQGSLLVLKASADKKIAVEEKLAGADAAVKKNQSVLGDMMNAMKYGAQKASDWLLGEKNNRNILGKAADGVGNFASAVGKRVVDGARAVGDNVAEAGDRWTRGDYSGAAGAALDATTAPMRYATGMGVPKEPKLTGNAKDRERVLIQEAIKAGITNPAELAMLLGQVAAETGGFSQVVENLKYRPEVACKLWPKRFPSVAFAKQILSQGVIAFADHIYNGRMGNSAPGDGYKYRGRGLMQLTGKANYAAFARATGIDVISNPDLVACDPRVAALSAIHYWKTRVQGKANTSDLQRVTKLINGGFNGLEHRRSYFAGYLKKFSGKSMADIIAEYASGKVPAAPGSPTAKASAPPVTTTTTANGSKGGVAPAQKAAAAPATKPSVSTPVNVKAGSAGTSSLQTGGGYAAMAAGVHYEPTAAAAPSITSTASLDAAAASQRADEAARAAAAQREREAQTQRTRAAEAQSTYQSQTDAAVMSRVGEILQKSYEAQLDIKKNTADTVSVLRDILRAGGLSTATAATSESVTSAAPATKPASQRPVQRKAEQVPVSVRFTEPNG
jgi:predicted chitinase